MYNNTYYQPTQPAPAYPQPLRQQPAVGLKGRPVSSIDEARATSIDFDGSVFYFPDLANKRIYTKQINLDGTASLFMYELKEIPAEPPMTFVTREEFENAINQLKKSFTTAPTVANDEFKF